MAALVPSPHHVQVLQVPPCVIEIDEPDHTVALAPPSRSRLLQPRPGMGTVAAAAARQTLLSSPYGQATALRRPWGHTPRNSTAVARDIPSARVDRDGPPAIVRRASRPRPSRPGPLRMPLWRNW
ncbi:hypothetical protein FDV58_03770 [Bradyrhizobium elkanii]|uniref:Uncharacterized protein n=1 Tax=Bradyrhizobium elkanii TaxID=29448 RepID=A0A4V6CY93_BRAEL|nr:hypothetical protein [Bradyrhizobium sp. BR2003]TKV83355.1 hypothetical protein FDV58_03770 [Bradyrhizobium elkanii]